MEADLLVAEVKCFPVVTECYHLYAQYCALKITGFFNVTDSEDQMVQIFHSHG